MPTRFVILLHRIDDGEHWDLMIERGDVLWTWQLTRSPLAPSPWPIPARRIGDHRRAYLDYEGPISGNRGEVTRVESGTVKLTEEEPHRYTLQLTGTTLAGQFTLAHADDDLWTFDRLHAPPPKE